jgi:uridine phosphorylase
MPVSFSMSETTYYEAMQAKDTVTEYHLRIKPGDVGKYALLPGDPHRVGLIAEHLQDTEEIAYEREFRTVTGTYKGIKVSATSTGIGGPSAAIAVEELAHAGTTHFIRVGSTGGFQDNMSPGDLVISQGVISEDGVTRSYVPENFPSVPDHFLTHFLIESALELKDERGFAVHFGIGSCGDFFYPETIEWIQEMHDLGVTNAEMESSAIFSVAFRRRLHAASICSVSLNLTKGDVAYEIGPKGNEKLVQGWHNEIDVALEAIARYEADPLHRRLQE